MNHESPNKSLIMLALVLAGISAVPCAQLYAEQADATAPAAAALCPVMAEPIDPSVRIDTDSGPIYWCCPGCIEKYQKNPDKYADKVEAQRKALAGLPRVQVICPLSGDPIDKKVHADHAGRPVYFCGDECRAKFAQDPDKYAARLAATYSYQTTCPFSGDPVDPAASVEHVNGQRIYFCCMKCSGKYAADPAQFTDKLAKIGIHVDPKNAVKSGA